MLSGMLVANGARPSSRPSSRQRKAATTQRRQERSSMARCMTLSGLKRKSDADSMNYSISPAIRLIWPQQGRRAGEAATAKPCLQTRLAGGRGPGHFSRSGTDMTRMEKPHHRAGQRTGQGNRSQRPEPARSIGCGRRRGLRAQSRPHDRGRRQGARRLYEAARGRQNQRRTGRRRHRRGQDRRPGRGILAVRSASARSNCRPASAAPISICGPARSSAWPARPAAPVAAPDAEGQALCRSGMVAEPVLRFSQAGLSAHRAMGRPAGQGRRRHRRAHQAPRPRSTSSRSPTRSRRRISC